ncbi:acyl-CoA dehydrogenase [Platysternon megacephalum]|uniref:Acyl-CoA dehydrogenase n=1 Tax=Platysternon megacephalum TaxID=55544 RepID=A0A4D9DC48_9SAUR|nr:acyl-CoA dehydrogenase [Platysternon megacephalum]
MTDPTVNFGANDWLIEELYAQYLDDPTSVDETWVAYFKEYAPGSTSPAVQTAPRQQASAPAPTQPAPQPAAQPIVSPVEEVPANVVDAPANAAGSRLKKAPAKKQPAESRREKKLDEPKPSPTDSITTVLRGAPMRTARNMEESLVVPTATSVRELPMKLPIEARREINDHLRRNRGGKISFTHIIAYAMVQAVKAIPAMNNHFAEIDGKPNLVTPAAINLGVAIDVKKADGSRALVVPSIKNAGNLKFAEFLKAYEDIVARSRENKLTVDDFAGTTCTITNPGGIGTTHSIPRLMGGQSFILGVGAIDYPAEVLGSSQEWRDERAISKVTTLTSTYDHRVIQGAQSGEFLKYMSELLLGLHKFYDHIYESLRIPFAPMQWGQDEIILHEDQITKQARLLALIEAYRNYGHLAADIDPLSYDQAGDLELALGSVGLTLWDLDRKFSIGDFGGRKETTITVREVVEILRDAYARFKNCASSTV